MAATQSEREQLRRIIQQWNENRLDLFALSEPSEVLEFHGVMRFYFQEAGQKVATKCLRVSSTATARAVIDALVEKFHPDLRMLTTPQYSLWEVHENGEERKLSSDEKPLLVQLNWHKDDREGRFLLKREGEQYLPLNQLQHDELSHQSMKRKLSRREKKELKKQQKRNAAARSPNLSRPKEAEDVAQRLYGEVPPTNFTRTISNPEIVMKKRREKKLQQKLREMREGGSLKIYGVDLSEEKPYVTLLVSSRDKAEKVVKETLEKYGLDRHDPAEYCLVEAILSPRIDENENTKGYLPPLRERILDDHECPLLILSQQAPEDRGNMVFHVKHKPVDMPRNKRKKPRTSTSSGPMDQEQETLPFLLQLNPDGTEIQGESRIVEIYPNVTEVGSDRALTHGSQQSLPLFGPYVHPRHCVLAYMDGVVTITPCTPTAEIQVNGQAITGTTILRHGFVLRIGRSHVFRFLEPETSHSGMPRSQSMPSRVIPGGNSVTGTGQLPCVGVNGAQPNTMSMLAGRDAIPAIIELLDNAEDAFISAVIRDIHPGKLQFKLAPVYLLYMCCRYRVSPHYHTSLMLSERLMRMKDFLTKVTNLLHVVVQDHCHDAEALALWLANTSELLNFSKLDRDLGSATRPEPQESLADAIGKAFAHLTASLKEDLNQAMPAILDPNLDDANSTGPCLQMMSGAMTLLRHCRVNAALSIQVFSQLFHYVNMYLFNWLVSREGGVYCCRSWGQRFARRLSHIQGWAYKQGLELAAECHLDRIAQAIKLLETPKTLDHLATLGGTCYKLNSLQVRNLLERYKTEPGELTMEPDLIENVVKLAENQADESLRSEGRTIQVEEEIDLQLPFLLPDDGYSPDSVKGVPSGLQEFVDSLLSKGICRMIVQPSSSGHWTVHLNAPGSISFEPEPGESNAHIIPPGKQPEIVQISFPKGESGIGLSIVLGQGFGQAESGIYVKKVVPGSAADKDGRLEAGDQLLKVNQQSLMGISQEEAAMIMSRAGSVVSFEVAKQAALYNGLANSIFHPYPSPDMAQQDPRQRKQAMHQSDQNIFVPRHQQVGFAGRPDYRQPHSGHQRYPSHSGYPVHRHQQPQQGQSAQHARSASVSNLEQERVGQASTSQHEQRNDFHRQNYQNVTYQGQRQQVFPAQPAAQYHPILYGDRHSPTPATIMSHSAEFPRRISPTELPYDNEAEHHQLHPLRLLSSPRNVSRRPPSVEEVRLYRAQNLNVGEDDWEQSSPPASIKPAAVWNKDEQDRMEKEIDDEVIRLMQEQADMLEQKEFLTEQEERRYRALKYELTYQQRLKQESRRRSSGEPSSRPRSTDDGNLLSELGEFEPALSTQDTVWNSPLNATSLSQVRRVDEENRPYSAVGQDGGGDEYYSRAEEKYREEAMRQRNRSQQERLGILVLDTKSQRRIEEENVEVGKCEMHKLQTDMSSMSVEEQQRLPVAEDHCINGNTGGPRRRGPEVPPKRRVAFQDSEILHEAPLSPSVGSVTSSGDPQENGDVEDESVNKRYVYIPSENVPRSQILGAQEVYRDPRQERLHRLQQQQAEKSSTVDGSNLDFKTKMKMFAKQLGENTPSDRVKVSRAQRDIEEQMTPQN